MEIDAFNEAIDQGRAELLKADPKNAELYGLDPKEVEANARRGTADVTTPDVPVQQQPVETDNDVEIGRALNNPVVVEALKGRFDAAEQARSQYANALNYANQVAQANLVDHLPELARLPLDQWQGAIMAAGSAGSGTCSAGAGSAAAC
jgi:hypothetical protein